MADWTGVVMSTAPTYAKGAADHLMRTRPMMALLNQKKRITYNQSGRQYYWKIKYLQATPTAYSTGAVTYAPINRLVELTLNQRGYILTDKMDEKERLQNRGDVAIINRYKDVIKSLTEDMKTTLCAELQVDGYATGNDDRFCGYLSCLGNHATVVAADLIAQPSDTYAGKSTIPGNESGSWSSALTTKPSAQLATDWPHGKGSADYDYLSPKLINWSSTSWGTGLTTFEANGERVFRQGATWCHVLSGPEGKLDLWTIAPNLMTAYKNSVSPMQRIQVEANTPLRKLGFTDVMYQDGVEIIADFDIPVDTGFGLNFDQIELRCMYDKLIHPVGPTYDPGSHSYLWLVGTFGNMLLNPKSMAYIKNYA